MIKNQVNNQTQDLDQLLKFLQTYKLSHYFQTFVTEGFDKLLSLYEITEADLISLSVKRGHRRILQRAIATARGIPISTPIIINYGYEEPEIPVSPKPGTTFKLPKKKRQYVPSKPVTAFDELLNEVKLEFEGLILSEVTSIAYERWNKLTVPEKEKYEREALHANSDYVLDIYNSDNEYITKRTPSRYISRYRFYHPY